MPDKIFIQENKLFKIDFIRQLKLLNCMMSTTRLIF